MFNVLHSSHKPLSQNLNFLCRAATFLSLWLQLSVANDLNVSAELHSEPNWTPCSKNSHPKTTLLTPPPSPCFCPHSCCHRSYAGSRLPSPKFFLSVVLLLHPLLILEDLLQQQHVPPLVKRRRHSTATDRPANQRRAGPMEQLQKERKKNVTSKKVLYFEKFHFLWLFS